MEPELPLSSRQRFGLAARQRCLEHGLIELPGPVRIGIRQCCRLRRFFYTEVAELAFRCRQPATDLPQALRVTQMTEQHRHQLLPAGEAPLMSRRLVFLHARVKLQPREKLQNLTEYAAYSIHGRGLLSPLVSVLAEPDSKRNSPCLFLLRLSTGLLDSIHSPTR